MFESGFVAFFRLSRAGRPGTEQPRRKFYQNAYRHIQVVSVDGRKPQPPVFALEGVCLVKRGSQIFAARIISSAHVAWALLSGLILFVTVSVWIEPWLKSRFHRFPSLVPKAHSAVWFFDFGFCLAALMFLALSAIPVIRNPSLRLRSKVSLGIAAGVALVLMSDWYRVTSGRPAILSFGSYHRPHSVTLTWNPSSSKIAGYNVYRSLSPGGYYRKLNSSLLPGVTFSDTIVENGVVYYYAVRAVDAGGHESVNSNEVWVQVPR